MVLRQRARRSAAAALGAHPPLIAKRTQPRRATAGLRRAISSPRRIESPSGAGLLAEHYFPRLAQATLHGRLRTLAKLGDTRQSLPVDEAQEPGFAQGGGHRAQSVEQRRQ